MSRRAFIFLDSSSCIYIFSSVPRRRFFQPAKHVLTHMAIDSCLATKGKGRILIQRSLRDDRTSALYNRRKWQLIGKSQWCSSANCGHPIARINVQLDPRQAASKHTTAPINRTRPSPRKHSPDVATRARKQTSDYSLLLSLSTSKGRKAESTWLAGYIPK